MWAQISSAGSAIWGIDLASTPPTPNRAPVAEAASFSVDSFAFRVSDGRLEATATTAIAIHGARLPGRKAFLPGVAR